MSLFHQWKRDLHWIVCHLLCGWKASKQKPRRWENNWSLLCHYRVSTSSVPFRNFSFSTSSSDSALFVSPGGDRLHRGIGLTEGKIEDVKTMTPFEPWNITVCQDGFGFEGFVDIPRSAVCDSFKKQIEHNVHLSLDFPQQKRNQKPLQRPAMWAADPMSNKLCLIFDLKRNIR